MIERWGKHFVIVHFVAILSFTPQLHGEDAADVFKSIYGTEVSRVEASRDVKDDVELAATLVRDSQQVENVELLVLMFEKAYALASRSPDGYDSAVEAMQKLSAKSAEHALKSLDRVATLRHRQYLRAAKADRVSAGNLMADALIALAQAQEKADNATAALKTLRKGLTRAVQMDDAKRETIRKRFDELQQRTRLAGRIDRLKDSLKKNPNDAVAAKSLALIYIVDHDEPKLAGPLTEVAGDEELSRFVELAGTALAEIKENDLQKLADWYREHSIRAKGTAKIAMLRRAYIYYRRLLDVHPKEDLIRTKVTLALKQVESQFETLGVKPPPVVVDGGQPNTTVPIDLASNMKPGDSVDLLALIDVSKDRIAGQWDMGNGTLSSGASGNARLELPVLPNGDFRLTARIKRIEGNDSINFIVPVGPTQLAVTVGAKDKVCGLGLINRRMTKVRHEVKSGADYNLVIEVRRPTGKADVRLFANGKKLFSGAGPLGALSLDHNWALRSTLALGLGTSASAFRIDQLKFELLSGEAKLLRGNVPAVDLIDKVAKQIASGNRPKWKGRAWGVKDGVLRNLSGGYLVRIPLPYSTSGSYRMNVQWKCDERGHMAVLLPVGSTAVVLQMTRAVSLQKVYGAVHGATGNVTTNYVEKTEPGREYKGVVEVRVDGAGPEAPAEVTAVIDGVQALRWMGMQSHLSMTDNERMDDPSLIGLSAIHGVVSFSQITVERLPDLPKSIDLLKDLDLDKDIGRGVWRQSGNGGIHSSDGSRQVISLPVAIDGDYRVSAFVSRERRLESANFLLPIPGSDKHAHFILGGFANKYSGFQIKQVAREGTVPPLGIETAIRAKKGVRIDMDVRRNGDTVTLTATYNGRALPGWTGNIDELGKNDYWIFKHRRAVALGTWIGMWRFHDVRLTMHKGEAKRLRPSAEK